MTNRPTASPDLTGRVMDTLGYSNLASRRWWQRERCSLACVIVGVGLFGGAMGLMWSTDTGPTLTAVNSSQSDSFRPKKASLVELPNALLRLLVPTRSATTPLSGGRSLESGVNPINLVAPLPWFGIEATPVPGCGYEAGVARAPGQST